MRLTEERVISIRKAALDNGIYNLDGHIHTDLRLDAVYDMCDTIESQQQTIQQLESATKGCVTNERRSE